jgi:hypothetical protein
VLLTKCYVVGQIKGDEMGGSCGTFGRSGGSKLYIQLLVGK